MPLWKYEFSVPPCQMWFPPFDFRPSLLHPLVQTFFPQLIPLGLNCICTVISRLVPNRVNLHNRSPPRLSAAAIMSPPALRRLIKIYRPFFAASTRGADLAPSRCFARLSKFLCERPMTSWATLLIILAESAAGRVLILRRLAINSHQ